MSIKNIIIINVILIIIIASIILGWNAMVACNRDFDRRIATFEAKLPSTVLIQDANEWGYSDSFMIDEAVFLNTIKIYNITELWRENRAPTYVEYSFVFDGIVYFYRM